MFTRCPHCHTVYEPTATQLAQGHGHLLCGVCEQEFDALEQLSEHPFAASGRGFSSAHPPRMLPSVFGATDEADAPQQPDIFDLPVLAPAFVARNSNEMAPSGKWWAIAAALMVMLFLQIVLSQRNALAADPMWRGPLLAICRTLDCRVVPWTEPQQIEVSARNVGPHPSVPGALLVQLSFRNESGFDQVWPQLELALLDLSGKPQALRRFSAEQYLGAKPQSPTLRNGQSAQVTLEIADPGKQAIAYAFDFR